VTAEALVVAAAVVRDGRLLAVRRTRPAELRGRWELPGGKVDVDEMRDAALARELQEELGIGVQIHEWLPTTVPIGDGQLRLTVALVTITSGEPTPVEHDAVRWLAANELGDVDWLEPDRPFLDVLRRRLLPASRPTK
jgi:8-oxo-dGTP diphosphatase